jgi:pilus assembly protein CpaE
MTSGPYENADKTLRVLIVGADRTLEGEFRHALSGVPEVHGVVYFADTYRQALEAARGRQPNFILIDIDRSSGEIAGLSKDLHELAAGAAIAGAFKREQLDQGQSESATLIELLRSEVRDFLRRPLSATELRSVLDRLFSRTVTAGPVQRGHVVSFLSNKGGVGKSTLSVNVACALALRHPDDVLLIDTALQVGTAAMLLGLKPTASIVDAVRERDRLDPTLLRNLTLKHGTGLRLLAAPADALEGAEVDDEAIARIVNMARRAFKYVIVDTFPIIDNIMMTILDLTDVAFVVVQGTAPAVAGIARLLPVLDGLGVPASRQRLILNYNYQPFLGNLRAVDIADRLRRTMDYVVPYEKRVLTSMNTGSPHILHASRWRGFKRVIEQMADDITNVAIAGDAEAAPADGPDELRPGSDRRRGLTSV